MTYDPVAVIEAAYRPGGDDRSWLGAVVEGVAGLFGAEQPVMALMVGRDGTPRAQHGIHLTEQARLVGSLFREAALTDGNVERRIGAGPLTSLRRTAAGQAVAARIAAAGFSDCWFLLGGDAHNAMCVLAIPRNAALPRQKRYALTHLAAHLASGVRLRAPTGAEAAPDDVVDVILGVSGEVEHAEPDARDGLERLRVAALAAERARGGLRTSAPEEAIAAWRAMVDGRWSLVDRFDSDGRRFLVARRNAPRAQAVRTLSERETFIARRVARGDSNKLIAYELGLSEATIATHVSRIKAKLGVRTRVALATLFLSGP